MPDIKETHYVVRAQVVLPAQVALMPFSPYLNSVGQSKRGTANLLLELEFVNDEGRYTGKPTIHLLDFADFKEE